MENIVLFDPGIRSLNLGDQIIMKSAENELADLLKNRYVIHCATHAPAVTFYQNTKLNPRMRIYLDAKYKFICGSNLLWRNLMLPRPTFNVNPWNSMPYEGSILLGVGTGAARKTNLYTKNLYKKILSRDYVHSVRDDSAKAFVEELGFQAINTGCPTMWKFNDEFCEKIPKRKAKNVIFTLTDYSRSKDEDQILIDTLLKNYETVYFWVQGVFDMEYFSQFQHTERIKIVAPTIENYSEILSMQDIEYVGTRLHAGMFALQHQKRTIILAVDNRVRSLQKTYHLNCIERSDVDGLDKMINGELNNKISINTENIDMFMSQFERAQEISVE